MTPYPSVLILLLSLLLAPGCSPQAPPASEAPSSVKAPEGSTPAPTAALSAPIPKGKVISPLLVTGGQPTKEALTQMAAQGLKAVVNLKTAREMPFDEAAEAKRLGLTYVSIPMAGKSGLKAQNVERLEAVLAEGQPTLVHCQSGNRVGALFALHAQRYKGASVEDAMALGLSHGMTGLKGAVLEHLKVNAERNFVKTAAQKVGLFKAALGAELKAALTQGGAAHAIGVCADKAPAIAEKMSDERLSIRRVGTRVRNTKTNTPSSAMRAVLQTLTREKPVHVGMIDGKEAAVHALFIDKPVCVSCHGDKASMAPAVLSALAERYPDDAATGYAMGQLRGAVVVERRGRP